MTIADVLARWPGFAANRIRVYPPPGTATEQDILAVDPWSEIGVDGSLLGGEVLPGFEVSLAELFARAEGPRDE